MRGVLISTLGRSKYEDTVYVLPEGKEFETKLVGKALKEYLKPNEVYVIGTSESLWSLADELLGDYKKVVVPFGKSTEEFWEMFRIIVQEIDVEGKELYIDITHSFRAIPLLVSTVMNLFEKVKGAKIKGVYYGIYELAKTTGRAPIVDLLPIIELNRWIEGFTLFNNYGDGDYLAGLIEERLSSLGVEDKKRLSRLGPVPKLLRKYSQAVGFTALDFIQSSVKQVDQKLSELGDLPTGLEALELLKDSFSEISKRLNANTDTEPLWKRHMRAVRWLFEKRRYSQSIISLRECILTYIAEAAGINPYSYRDRERISEIFREDCKRHQVFSKDMNDLFSKITRLRNDSGHAFMKKAISENTIKSAISDLERYIEKVEKLLLENNFINDMNKLRDRLISANHAN